MKRKYNFFSAKSQKKCPVVTDDAKETPEGGWKYDLGNQLINQSTIKTISIINQFEIDQLI